MLKRFFQYWYNLSIRNKLLVFFIITILGFFMVTVYIQKSNYKYMSIFNENLKDYYIINNLNILIEDNKSYVHQYLKNPDIENIEKYYQSKNQILEEINNIDEKNKTQEGDFSIKAIRNSMEEYFNSCEEAVELIRKKSGNHYIPYYKATNILQYTNRYIQQLLYTKLKEGSWLYYQLIEEARIMRLATWFVVCCIMIISLVFAIFFSEHITKPIKKLAKYSLKIAEGDLDVGRVSVKSTDEVQILAESFNKMSTNIRNYINDLTAKSELEKQLHQEEMHILTMEKQLKETEFKALQSQINPHFLFNTLNTIARTALFEKAPQTKKLIEILSDLFRYNLKSQEQIVTLEKELSIVKQYIELQKYRFKDRVEFELRSLVDTQKVVIPSLTVQPFIENAFIHGIEPKLEGGKIRLKIFKHNNNVYISIIDNGIGMSDAEMKKLMLDGRKGHITGIGISNVSNRLERYYKNQGKIRIKSKKGVGTIVFIKIDSGIHGGELYV